MRVFVQPILIAATSMLLGACFGQTSLDHQSDGRPATGTTAGGAGDVDGTAADGTCSTEGLDYAADIRPILERSCFSCHAGDAPVGRVSLDGMMTESDARLWLEWDGLLARVERNEMPPPGTGAPLTACEKQQLARWVGAVCDGPGDPGRTSLQRLNKEQLHHSLRELLDLPEASNAVADVPDDATSRDGFNNNAELMVTNAEVVRALLNAADTAVGTALSRSDAHVLACTGSTSQAATAPETRWDTASGSAAGREVLTTAGWLVFQVPAAKRTTAGGELWIHAAGTAFAGEPPVVQVNIDDLQVTAALALASPTVRAYRVVHPFAAGAPSKVGLYFKNPTTGGERRATIQKIEIRPAAAVCTQEILARFASRAFRRPATDAELVALSGVVQTAEKNGSDWRSAIGFGLQATLMSPTFLFRVIESGSAAGVRSLTAHELATRLSFLLWNSGPDDELLELATSGALLEDATLAAQVKRMLADARAVRFSESFAGQWLSSRRVLTPLVAPDPALLPDLDDELRAALKAETDLLFHDVLTTSAPLARLLDAEHTFANERLARHYGVQGIFGPDMQKTSLAGTRRRGVLTHAGLLMGNSASDRSSPIKRGFWILDRITCTPPGSPPTNIDTSAFESSQTGTIRERLEVHREQGACASCHASMDPVGLAFEHFDAVGKYRTVDEGAPVDATGVLPDGRAFTDHEQLVDLLKVDRQFTRCATQKLYAYALGRSATASDVCNIRRIADRHHAPAGSLADLITDIVLSDAFRQTRSEP